MTRNADLYLSSIAFDRYAPGESCNLCHAPSLKELLERLKRGELPNGPCAHWPSARQAAFRSALTVEQFVPPVPALELPRPVEPGLLELNPPVAGSPLLVTGNSKFTQAVLLAILSRTGSPLRLLFADTNGHTVDMAMVFQAFTAEGVASAVERAAIQPTEPSRIVLPGLTRDVAPSISERLGREVEIGPICAAEIPLYLGEDWKPAG